MRFTSSINLIVNSDLSNSISDKIIIKNIITQTYGYQYLGIGTSGYVNINVWNKTITLPAEIGEYSRVTGTFYLDGKVDNSFYYYLNGYKIHESSFGVDSYFSEDHNPARVYRGQTSYTFDLNKTTNTFSVNIFSNEDMWYGEIFSSSIIITTYSK